MNRIESVPCVRHWNYRDFSPHAERQKRFIKLGGARANVRTREPRFGKEQRAKEQKLTLAQPLESRQRQLGDNRRRARVLEMAEATVDPRNEFRHTHSVPQIVADVGHKTAARCR